MVLLVWFQRWFYHSNEYRRGSHISIQHLYDMTLDDINAPELPLANPEKDNEQFMHVAEDPTAELDDSPEYPSGLDPELREGINIVQDMLKQQTSTK